MKKLKESDITVIKNDGSHEKWDPSKIYKYVKYACDGTNIQPSELLIDLDIKLTKRIKSSDIQQTIIKTAADKITEDAPDYAIVAGRLLNQSIRKNVFNSYSPIDFYEHILDKVKKKIYDSNILEYYTKDEIDELNKFINHKNDELYKYIAMVQFNKKYLIRDKNDLPLETPQFVFMLIPMYIFHKSENRINLIKDFYSKLSSSDILLSSPIITGVRTRLRMFSSCAGIKVGDSQEGIANTFKDVYKLTLNRAGIGLNPGQIRGSGAVIDKGREKHTGIVPILKVGEKISLSAMQPGTGRGGAITNYYPFFHWELEDLLELKNNKGTDDNRVRQSDHAFIFNKLFYRRVKNNEDITLFYMNDVGNLYMLIGDDEKFTKKYEELENRRGIKKRKVNAREIYRKFWNERMGTGRLYKVNADEFQSHSAFKIPVNFSNLCTEINLPAFEYEDFEVSIKKGYKGAMDALYNDLIEEGEWYNLFEHLMFNELLPDTENFKTYKSFLAKPKDIKNNNFETYTFNFYEIFVCILAGINLGSVKDYKDIEDSARLLVRFLDELIDYQEYPIEAMEKGATGRRALGISFSGVFHYLAKKNLDYNTLEARNEIHRATEALYYGAITESIKLAKEKGICKYYKDTKYSDGLLTIDTYNKNVDELVQVDYMYNWDKVREDLKKYGLRNSTLLTMVPASNSARLAGTTLGIEPPQDLVTSIEDKRVRGKFPLPDLDEYRDFYERNNIWNIDTAEYYKLIAVIQKFVDQAISLNQYNDYLKYKDEKIPYSVILKQDTTAIKYGIKTMYYSKTNSDNEGLKHIKIEDTCSDGGCTL